MIQEVCFTIQSANDLFAMLDYCNTIAVDLNEEDPDDPDIALILNSVAEAIDLIQDQTDSFD